jgi:negative regulator of flagellin synthesis FlgM
MKIHNPADKAAGAAPAAKSNRVQPGDSAKASAVAVASHDEKTTVELSSAASSLLSGSATGDFDTEKVARITQAIADGKFEINPEKIADRLIANANEVLGKAQH